MAKKHQKTRFNFTLKQLEELDCPDGAKRLRVHDTKVDGLAFRVTSMGAKAYFFYRRLPDNNENPRKIVEMHIGKFADMSIENARKKAVEYNHIVGAGKDPSADKEEKEITYDRLFQSYIENYAKDHTVTWPEAIKDHGRYFEPFKRKAVCRIKRIEVQKWMIAIAGEDRSRKHSANRALDQMKAVINYGRRKDLLKCDNPCVGVDKFPSRSRERFIQPGNEFARFAQALEDEPHEVWRDFFWMCLFVAARRSNVLCMSWDQISFELQTWTIPKTKNGDSQTIPLTPNALEILKRRYETENKHEQWVFPSDRKCRDAKEVTHLAHPKYAWKRIIERAEITNLRIHDLRRTAGSYMAIQGVSPTIIGKALGHRSQAATAMYARLTQDPVRQAMMLALNPLLEKSANDQN